MSFLLLLIIAIPIVLMFRSFIKTHDKKEVGRIVKQNDDNIELKKKEKEIAKLIELKKKEKEITKLFDLIKNLKKYNNYLDKNQKNSLVSTFQKIEIPEFYTFHKKSLENKFYEKIDLLFKFKNNLEVFLEGYNDVFFEKEKKRYKKFFSQIEKNPLTEEQQISVMTEEENTLVVSGAGTGKTSTIIAKTAYLIKKGICLPNNILVLAFNKDASEELKDRIEQKLEENNNLEIRTFHSFGYSVYEKANINRPSLSRLSENSFEFNTFIKNEIEKLLIDKKFGAILREYFTSYIKPFKSVFDFESIGEYYSHLKSENITITLKGEIVKSFEECEIANYLFLNQIKYKYENPYIHDTSSPKHRQYKPDFFLADCNIYIEHFAVNKQGAPPSFFPNYLEQMEWKRNLHKTNKTKLIETYSFEKSEGLLLKNLEKKLLKYKIKPNPMSNENILTKLNEKGRIMDFSSLISTFLNHFKSNELSFDEIRKTSNLKKQKDRYQAFIKIFEVIYNKYQKLLKKNIEIDFNDMILKARSLLINNVKNTPLTHVIVDEFQDISSARYKLIKVLSEINPSIKFFCVGDDWQSIYRFAGSLVVIMSQFEKYFGFTKITQLSQSFRLTQPLATLTNKFITKNPNQIKKDIASTKKDKRPSVSIYVESEDAVALDKILQDIESKRGNKNVLILGRYNHNIKNEDIQETVNKFRNLNINYKTVHSAKGLEEDYVIILDVNRGKLGFPSEITDDPLLELVMGEEDNYQYAEERRLFYVALTRSRNKVYLITTPHNQSFFIRELINDDDYEIDLKNSDEISNIDCYFCKTGWMVRRYGDKGPFYGCSNYRFCNYTREICKECEKGIYIDKGYGLECSNEECLSEPITCNSCGELLEDKNILNGKYGEFYKCFACGTTQDM